MLRENYMETSPLHRAQTNVQPEDPLSLVPDPGDMSRLYIDVRRRPDQPGGFPDGKPLADAIPKIPYSDIKLAYTAESRDPHFSPLDFWHRNFYMPPVIEEAEQLQTAHLSLTMDEYIDEMWTRLTRYTPEDRGTLIGVPCPDTVPGERYHEFYGWDAYFAARGHAADGRWDRVENSVINRAHLIERFGHVPNANRTYYLGRSQPPVFSHLVELLSREYGDDVLATYLPEMEREYAFWMQGAGDLRSGAQSAAHRRVVRLPDGSILNRHWDDATGPRFESFREDYETAQRSLDPERTYLELRSGAEIGWDYSLERLCTDGNLHTMRTTELIPVDLNSWLAHLEQTIADAYRVRSNPERAEAYENAATRRIDALNKYCWSKREQTYTDYDIVSGRPTHIQTAAMAAPLFAGIAPINRLHKVAAQLHANFLRKGGFGTTLRNTNQQWDGPSRGWAPLNLMAIEGLMLASAAHLESRHAGEKPGSRATYMEEIAREGSKGWQQTAQTNFEHTGKLWEKYNVDDPLVPITAGEYPLQSGFAWTNGVLRALKGGVERLIDERKLKHLSLRAAA